MKLTKQTYEMIAHRINQQVKLRCLAVGTDEFIKDHKNIAEALYATASFLAEDFAENNPAFDRQRFLTACGFPKGLVRKIYT